LFLKGDIYIYISEGNTSEGEWGKGAERGKRAFRPQSGSDNYERSEGRKEVWVGRALTGWHCEILATKVLGSCRRKTSHQQEPCWAGMTQL